MSRAYNGRMIKKNTIEQLQDIRAENISNTFVICPCFEAAWLVDIKNICWWPVCWWSIEL